MSNEFFWKLLEKEHKQAEAFCRKFTGDKDEGDDLYQDSLLIALTKFESLKEKKAFRPWLYRIMVNTFKNRQKKPWWKKRERLNDDNYLEKLTVDPTNSHLARLILRKALKTISVEERALLVLFEIEGWTIKELAILYQKSEGTLKSKLSRSRQKMRLAIARNLSDESNKKLNNEAQNAMPRNKTALK